MFPVVRDRHAEIPIIGISGCRRLEMPKVGVSDCRNAEAPKFGVSEFRNAEDRRFGSAILATKETPLASVVYKSQ